MRILAIGLGGAGTRIVDLLYNHDMKSRVECVSAIAVDIDGNSLRQLTNIPDNARMHFPAIDPTIHFDVTSTINVEEIMTLIQKIDTFEIDSIMIFAGLGGSLIDAIPQLATELRKSFIEPIFGVCILPMRSEGKKHSSKAADDIDRTKSVLDAMILFDNETWHNRLKADYNQHSVAEDTTIGSYKHKVFPDNPRDVYTILNEKIARQIGILLRAGEFSETGVEAAEIVLDAGEVLNTLKGNDLVAIGYATESLQNTFIDRFNQWRSETYFSETSHKRATRIVTLAKRAVYEEISIPCDITSAHKALVLIAGPSQELSMKGFQTVRKWIDRSISGLEMRSGDYPVMNTRFVGIIIVLSGITNIPRVTELNEIRREYAAEQETVAEEEIRAAQTKEEINTENGEEVTWTSTTVQMDNGKKKEEEESTLDITDLFENEAAESGYTPERETEIAWEEEYNPWEDEEESPLYSPSTLKQQEPQAVPDPEIPAYEGQRMPDEEESPLYSPSTLRREEPQVVPNPEITVPTYEDRRIPDEDVFTRDSMTHTERQNEENRDAMISVKTKPGKKGTGNQLSMPVRKERTVSDMTRMTDGGGHMAPKDNIFGLKEIPSSDTRGPRDTARVGGKISIGKHDKRPNDASFGGKGVNISSAKGPNDSAYMGSSFSVQPQSKANDTSLMGNTISAKSSKIRPNDSTLTGDSVRLSRGPPKTKEALNGDVRMSARIPAPRDDLLSRRAEQRLSKTQEAVKEPEKESPYKKGTISSGYEKDEVPEENEKADDLFWIN